MKSFNLVLLGKLCWRFKAYINGMWFKVLSFKYNVDSVGEEVWWQGIFFWWKNIFFKKGASIVYYE